MSKEIQFMFFLFQVLVIVGLLAIAILLREIITLLGG